MKALHEIVPLAAPLPQAPCESLANRPQTAIEPARAEPAATPREQSIARQKAAFVGEVYALARAQGVSLAQAAPIVATRAASAFPDLLAGGKHGASLLAGSRASHNYKVWARKLGTPLKSRAPDVDNWRALLPRYREASVYHRPGDERFWVLLANVYEHPNRLSLRYAYDLARRACATVRPPIDSPSFDSARRYYERHVDRRAVYLARHGEEAFRNNLAGYVSRNAPDPDEVWCSDHHIFDAAVRVLDPDSGAWRPVRPWLTAWLDWGSLWFAGYQIRAVAPNRDAIERSLRDAIERNDGFPPLHIYVDNGKDYRASGFARVPLSDPDIARLGSVAELLACKVHFALPYNARAKIVERIFRVVCEQFSKLWPSYRASLPQDRPEEADRLWTRPAELPTLDEFVVAWEKWLATIYHSAPSQGRALAGRSPIEARHNVRRLRPRMSPPQLYRAFLRELPGLRKIGRGGIVRALGREYRSDGLWDCLSPDAPIRVDQVRLKVDPDDVSTVWVFAPDGREIGPATAKPLLNPMGADDPATIEQLRSEIALTRRQTRQIKEDSARRRDLSRFHVGTHRPIGQLAGLLGQIAPARIPAPAHPDPVAEPARVLDVALLAELDTVLRDQSDAALADRNARDHADADLVAELALERR